MKTIYLDSSNLEYWQNRSTSNVMALGFFDGLHKGHKQVIQTAGELAKEKKVSFSVMSFFPHPKTVLSNDNADFDYLMPLSKKASILEYLGVDTFYIVKFDKDFLSLLPKQFVTSYLLDLGVVHAVAGFDFSYGYRGKGNIDRLKSDSANQIDVTKVGKVDLYGKKMSSTWIRELIAAGEVGQLANILGRFYETEGYWDGESFQLAPYYMLPAAGYYKVSVKRKGKIRETEVFIPASRNGIYLTDNMKRTFPLNERLDIIWSHKIGDVGLGTMSHKFGYVPVTN
ncbi:FAD synthetase family protein [Oceanobacillus senegalensis]|uniref:FAD synthetase family protein n=1 Tax=Oceanobacillus senegalensis TaxID=1936063 RepID=UPI000A30B84E|nr:FAD synthetase family protein [Oceanobacillus senegalensis]